MSKRNDYEVSIDLSEVSNISVENYYNFETKQFDDVKNKNNISIGYILSDDDWFNAYDYEEATREDLKEEELKKDDELVNIFNKYEKKLNRVGVNTLQDFVFDIDDYKIILEDEEFDYIENIKQEATDDAIQSRVDEHVNDFGYYGFWNGDSRDKCYIKYNKVYNEEWDVLMVFFTINFLESKTIEECYEEIEAFFYENELYDFYSLIDFMFNNIDMSIFSIEKLEIFKNVITKAEDEFFNEFDEEEQQVNYKRFLTLFKNNLEQKLSVNNTKTKRVKI